MFDVIDVTTGWKVDLIVRKDRAFSEEEFSRRLPVRIADVANLVRVHPPVERILTRFATSGRKLEEARRSGPLTRHYVERTTRFELATPTLARLCSTN